MEKAYYFEILNNIVIIRFTKQPNYDDFVDAVNDILENYPNKMRLWDVNTVGVDMSFEEVRNLSKLAATKLKPTRAAVVASTDVGFGVSRMYEAYRQQDQYIRQEQETQQEQLATRTFRSETEAIVWLNGLSE